MNTILKVGGETHKDFCSQFSLFCWKSLAIVWILDTRVYLQNLHMCWIFIHWNGHKCIWQYAYNCTFTRICIKNRVENARICFDIPTLTSCERGNFLKRSGKIQTKNVTFRIFTLCISLFAIIKRQEFQSNNYLLFFTPFFMHTRSNQINCKKSMYLVFFR